jgi:hypothetical protein
MFLFRHHNSAVALFDRVTWYGRKRGRPHRFAGAEVETGVMPRAANFIAVDDSLGERAAIVRACRPNGEIFVSHTSEEHGFSERVAEKLFAGLDCIYRDAGSEVGA